MTPRVILKAEVMALGVNPRAAGFTLIALMIAVPIIAILAGIAYPLYVNRIREARRVDAKSLVLKAANREKQRYTRNNQYVWAWTPRA